MGFTGVGREQQQYAAALLIKDTRLGIPYPEIYYYL
jgi:hypothetical protein